MTNLEEDTHSENAGEEAEEGDEDLPTQQYSAVLTKKTEDREDVHNHDEPTTLVVQPVLVAPRHAVVAGTTRTVGMDSPDFRVQQLHNRMVLLAGKVLFQ